MLEYQGDEIYVFYNQFGHPITLTKQDIDAIAEESADIDHSYVNKLRSDKELAQESYEELKSDILRLLG